MACLFACPFPKARGVVSLFWTATLLFAGVLSASASPVQAAPSRACATIDDFEAYEAGATPSKWSRNQDRALVPASRRTMEAGSHEAEIVKEHGNAFVRLTMIDYAYRLIKVSRAADSAQGSFAWDTDECPYLRWQWRVNTFPEGASEKESSRNDVAAAVYVTFGRDWLGRPKSIKYTYSSTLPVGTVTEYGPLKVLVVASATEGTGEWQSQTRDVAADYRQLFGERPDTSRPTGLQLFSDADDVPGARAVADFDEIEILRSLR